jgi:metal transporter CNNM
MKIIQLIFMFITFNCIKSKIIFLVPHDSKQEQTLNKEIEQIFQEKKFATGWLIEANIKHSFYIYLFSEKTQQSHSNDFYIFFTLNSTSCLDYADYTHIPILLPNKNNNNKNIHKIAIDIQLKHENNKIYYMCLSSHDTNETILKFDHQGNTSYLTVTTFENMFPLSIKLLFYTFFVLLNSTFNGLNLGLMSLSIDELKLLIKTSDSLKERKYAQNILPLRKKGNFLLCSILLSITMTSASSVLILDDLMQGFLAGLISTFVLCILGEIIPQALFSKYPLEIGSYTRKLTYFFIVLTSVFSFPLSKMVDCVLGTELPREYSRDSIRELIKKSIDLQDRQCKIINGALDLRKRYVSDVMIKLDRVFMLQQNECLNFETIVRIYNSGFSRIPVYNKERNDITGLIHIKDLMITDPSDEFKVKKLVQLFKRNVIYCYTSDSLFKMFNIFRRGMAHMAFVLNIVQTDEIDPYYECVGIITLNDIIETLVQLNISYDEKDLNSKSKGVEYLKKIIQSHKTKSQEYLNDELNSFISSSRLISSQSKLAILQVLSSKFNFYLY